MKLILCGGGSGEQNKLANAKLNEIINHDKPVLYVPLAMSEIEHPNYDDCYEWIKREIQSVDIPYIDIARSFKEWKEYDFNNYSAIYIGGGNTYKLLKGIKENGIFEKINEFLNNDGIIIGGSAGSVIFGKDIDIISSMDPNEVELKDTKGFNCLNEVSIFPHYINYKSKFTQEENEERIKIFTKSIIDFSLNKGKVFAIPEEDAIYINGNNYEFIGTEPYYICENGNMVKYEIDNYQTTKTITR